MEFIQQFLQSIDELLIEISEFKLQLNSLIQYKSNKKQIKENVNLQIKETTSPERKLKIKEGEYDRLFEYFQINKFIVENKQKMNYLIDKVQNYHEVEVNEAEVKKNKTIDKMNDLLIEMKQIEKEIKDKRFTKKYKKDFYDNMFIDSVRIQKMKEEKQKKQENKMKISQQQQKNEEKQTKQQIENDLIQQRNKNIETSLSENEMIQIENEIGRYFSEKLFDSIKIIGVKVNQIFINICRTKQILLLSLKQ